MELPYKISVQKHWFLGGFPEAITARSYAASIIWLNNFIKSYIERDLNQLFNIELNTSIVRNFWRMLAHNNGGIYNAENYARSLSITGPTVKKYLDYLEGAFLVRRLYPWYVNVNKRIVKSPKLYIRDSGLLHRLANISNLDELTGNILIGASWEGYVVEQIAQCMPDHLSMFFYRTQDGAEVDIVLVNQQSVAACIEIKLKPQTLQKGFFEAVKTLSPKRCFMVCQTDETFNMPHQVVVCNLVTFIKQYLPKL
jgi:uncharacterized protein